ncbi:MAG: aminopeptidase [Treponema sp.]|jgi:predicted aminopeptidase|nr:aminopeptidase [Treponema sp.]
MMKEFPSIILRSGPAFAACILLLLAFALCSGCYTLTQGITMLGYINRAVPLDSLDGDEDSRAFVERVRDIRRFATAELGLKENANYTTYVELDRAYLAAVVSACKSDAFVRHEWWFPVVGAVPYKGFFNVKDAQKEAAKLKKKNLDVWVRQVDGFSTLGWFSDPLYSYMREYPVHQLAELIIHELLHATVYIKSDSQFNEELAEFVGREGGHLYMASRFGVESPEYRVMLDSETDSGAYIAFIQSLIKEVDALYQSNVEQEEKLKQKAVIIAAAQSRVERDYETLFHTDNYRGFITLPVNNAYLELFRLYYSGGAYLAALFERAGCDLPRFIAAAKTITGKRDPKGQLEQALTGASTRVTD